MRIILDSTYFLPLYTLKVKVPFDCLKQILLRKHSYYYSDMVYFECNAKASKEPLCQDLNDYTQALISDELYKEISSKSQNVWEMACFYRKYHKDYIDCIHYATALIGKMDYFLSEEKVFKKIIQDQVIQENFASEFPTHKLVELINYSDYINEFPALTEP